jgi:hypothetical protein
MSVIVRYAELPMMFHLVGGKRVASTVSAAMATKFADRDQALEAAQNQFGDNGLEHVTFDDLAPKKVAAKQAEFFK